ncbi:heme utilization cystosolic carrier protein HutX [Aestuariirhabdus sp. Z084]|uniref:heme utilization cystosolic carrier protein HutX n=1 Tax=Aestuariirhabdus haliotis TaxID=2918751 RepID=UPI00201B43BF|nr:heme utilization cystosolic carrier protein HutX [Aestuariirhabdus haliotis]MCL6417469.1 heme utilization cystosolic carrier protein HutX [Aestuariirhabdus haliotis]MCL6421412.1 heme utilization cystosolic carrier protein HutX [Aestuariirhabdus haliotis]
MSVENNKLIELLQEVSDWGYTTTIILHGGSVFEFKGPFPKGELGQGFYNLKSEWGFEGHINLAQIRHLQFQDKAHRGRQSYALVFNDVQGNCIFKIFIGRDQQGVLYEHQVSAFLALKDRYSKTTLQAISTD